MSYFLLTLFHLYVTSKDVKCGNFSPNYARTQGFQQHLARLILFDFSDTVVAVAVGATRIGSKFGQHVISSKFGHQMAPLALVTIFSQVALDCLLAFIKSVSC